MNEMIKNLTNIYINSKVQNRGEQKTLELAISLFTAKEPIIKKYPTDWLASCPNCGVYLSERHHKHCSDCGQLINWDNCKNVQKDIVNADISSLSISVKVYIILNNNSIYTIKDILNKSLLDLLNLKRMTLQDVDNLIGALKEKNIDTSNWDKELNDISKR